VTYIENLPTRALSASLGMSSLDLSPVEVLALVCYFGHTAAMLSDEGRREVYATVNNEVRADMDKHIEVGKRVLGVEEEEE